MIDMESVIDRIFAISLVTILVAVAANGIPQVQQQDDLIKVYESSKPIDCLDAKQSDLAQESRIVGIQFESISFNIASALPNQKSMNGENKTKQSQEFDLGSGAQSTEESKPLAPVTEQPSTVAQVSTSEQVSTSTNDQSSTISTTSEPATTETLNPELPVGRKTVRHGSSVFCGEANPNGKSNKKLVLDRIIGGRKTEPGEFPFQVRLNIRSRRGSGICGGVVLDERHILTAAHCMTACVSQYLTTATIESSGVMATIGDHSIRSSDGEVEVDIEKITPHEKYDACNFYANDHDIALIKTGSPIEFKFTSDGYGSINRPCMPQSKDMAYKEGESVIVSGWGVTRDNSGSLSNILRYVQVPLVNTTRCQDTYGSRVTSDHVCAGYQSGGKDSCQGDSGGPLVRVVDNKYELVGIVSFGYGCGQPGAPGVYTRVASYIDWIKANL